jgi:hypothetical protein
MMMDLFIPAAGIEMLDQALVGAAQACRSVME